MEFQALKKTVSAIGIAVLTVMFAAGCSDDGKSSGNGGGKGGSGKLPTVPQVSGFIR